jgi:hypothetical protein
MQYPIKMEPALYEMLRGLLTDGIITQDGKTLDVSPVQDITIRDGVMRFNPPAKIVADYGVIKIQTTVSSLTVRTNGIRIEIDNSPIDLELKPK